MKRIVSKNLTGERALFKCYDTHISDSSFFDGESPLKESKNILVERCTFSWKYPLWYSSSINVINSRFTAEARAGIWYTSSIVVKDVIYEAVKGFRKCNNLILENVTFNDKDVTETLWNCHNVTIKNVKIGGPYFGMGCSSVKIDNLYIDGDYAFDGAKDVEIHNSKFITKDAFWNCENIVIYDSYIEGEYFGWNSKNVKLVRCTVSSLQGFCYMENLIMEDCKIYDTTLAFEYSSVNAKILTSVDSIKNPLSGKIICKGVDEIILDDDDIDHTQCQIIVED